MLEGLSRKVVEFLEEQFPKGTEIKVIKFKDESHSKVMRELIPDGSIGVSHGNVINNGSLLVQFRCTDGELRSTFLCYGVDQYRKVEEQCRT